MLPRSQSATWKCLLFKLQRTVIWFAMQISNLRSEWVKRGNSHSFITYVYSQSLLISSEGLWLANSSTQQHEILNMLFSLNGSMMHDVHKPLIKYTDGEAKTRLKSQLKAKHILSGNCHDLFIGSHMPLSSSNACTLESAQRWSLIHNVACSRACRPPGAPCVVGAQE